MTAYVIVQLKMTDRAAYDRYQARFFDVFSKIRRTPVVRGRASIRARRRLGSR